MRCGGSFAMRNTRPSTRISSLEVLITAAQLRSVHSEAAEHLAADGLDSQFRPGPIAALRDGQRSCGGCQAVSGGRSRYGPSALLVLPGLTICSKESRLGHQRCLDIRSTLPGLSYQYFVSDLGRARAANCLRTGTVGNQQDQRSHRAARAG